MMIQWGDLPGADVFVVGEQFLAVLHEAGIHIVT